MSYSRFTGGLLAVALLAAAAAAATAAAVGASGSAPSDPGSSLPLSPALLAVDDYESPNLPRQGAPVGPWSGRASSCFRGGDVLPGVISLVTFEGGTFAALDECARIRDVASISALSNAGTLTRYYLPGDTIFTDPDFNAVDGLEAYDEAHWNAPFVALFPDGIPPYTPLMVRGGSSGSPSPDDGLWWASLAGEFTVSRVAESLFHHPGQRSPLAAGRIPRRFHRRVRRLH